MTPKRVRVKTVKVPKPPKSQKMVEARLRKEVDHSLSRVRTPKHLFSENSTKTSTKLLKAQNRWLNKYAYIVWCFYQKEQLKEIDRRKALARASGNRRQERILENGFEFYTVTQVLVAYGKDCHLCHEPIDLKASRRVGIGDWLLGLHIDHLVAIALGGPDTLANVRPSHAICNLKKGTKAA